MTAGNVYGVTRNADLAPGLIQRETRPFRLRIKDTLAEAGGFLIVMGGIIVTIWPFFGLPMIFDVLCLMGVFVVWMVKRSVRTFPFRNPMIKDPPKGYKGDGIGFLGNERETLSGIWFSNDDLRTHMLVFGSTGSGKTRFLLGLLYQSLLMGSGCLYVDGKADNTVWWLVYSLCRRLGREDDILVINYLTGGETKSESDVSLDRLTNTTNPFAQGSAEGMRSMIAGLMRDSGGDGDMWKGRALALLGAVLKALSVMRDRAELDLDVEAIRDHLPLNTVVDLSQRTDLPESAISPIKKYLLELPGFTEDDAMMGNISNKAYEQHAFLTMQLTEVMGDLSETYGHIFKATRGEVDFRDVVFNRRILFVMLPSLEKDPDALAGLGKLVVAGVRSALAPALGNKLEGNKREVIDQKPTNAKVPFLMILDEYGYYAVKGFAVVAAQARSLGVSVIFAGQDFPSFEKASKEEARSVVANTNIKISMKLEDEKDTAAIFEGRGGEAEVTQTTGYESKGTLGSGWSDQRQARVERRKRINIRDLVSQKPGQAHVIFGDEIVRCNLFYADPKEVSEAVLNKFMIVSLPDKATLDGISGSFKKLERRFSGNLKVDGGEIGGGPDGGIEDLLGDYRLARSRGESPVDAAALAVGSLEWRAMVEDQDMEERATRDKAPEQEGSAEIRRPEAGPLPGTEAAAPPDAREVLSVVESASDDSQLVEDASEVSKRFSSILSDVVVANYQRHKGGPMSEADRRGMNPRQQLIDMEMRMGRSEGAAASEADRALDLLDERVQYPGSSVPSRRSAEDIHGQIESLMSRLNSKTESASEEA